MRPIPAPRLGDAHGLIRAIEQRGRLRTDEFVTEFKLEELFPPGLENAVGRMRHFISYARSAGLVREDRGVVELTDIGRRYIRSADPDAFYDVSPQQAEWLRRQLRERHMTDSIFHGLSIGLSLLTSVPPGVQVATLDFGRSMAYLGRAGWDNENTLQIQGERHLTLLRDMELIDEDRRVTPAGHQLRSELTLPIHMALVDLASQLNPGGADAVRAAATAEFGGTPEPEAPPPPSVSEAAPAPEAEEDDDDGYHTAIGLGAATAEPSHPPVVPRASEPPPSPPYESPTEISQPAPPPASVPPPSAAPAAHAGATEPPPQVEPATRGPQPAPPPTEAPGAERTSIPPPAPRDAPPSEPAAAPPPEAAPADAGAASPEVGSPDVAAEEAGAGPVTPEVEPPQVAADAASPEVGSPDVAAEEAGAGPVTPEVEPPQVAADAGPVTQQVEPPEAGTATPQAAPPEVAATAGAVTPEAGPPAGEAGAVTPDDGPPTDDAGAGAVTPEAEPPEVAAGAGAVPPEAEPPEVAAGAGAVPPEAGSPAGEQDAGALTPQVGSPAGEPDAGAVTPHVAPPEVAAGAGAVSPEVEPPEVTAGAGAVPPDVRPPAGAPGAGAVTPEVAGGDAGATLSEGEAGAGPATPEVGPAEAAASAMGAGAVTPEVEPPDGAAGDSGAGAPAPDVEPGEAAAGGAPDLAAPAGVPAAPADPVGSVPPPAAMVRDELGGGGFVDARAVRAAAEESGLRLPVGVYANVVAALASGRHLLLTGAPGAGKTTLALAVARAAAQGGRAQGATVVTAGPDVAALLAEAGRRGRWLVLDELDRVEPDAILGPLATFLAGLPVTLAGKEVAPAADWRLVATWSGPLPRASVLRRFAVVEVGGPSPEALRAALREATQGDATAAAAAERLLPLADSAPIGAGVFLAAARHAAARNAAAPADAATLAREAYAAHLAPLLDDGAAGDRLGELLDDARP